MDPILEIKARLAIEDVVASYMPLKKSGKYLKACCPFHQEKTPSFFVNPERQIAYCFSCHKGGDVFQFIQDIENIEFREALELLAEKAHIDLPKNQPGKVTISSDEKDRLKSLHNDASKYFVQTLAKTAEGGKVMKYLEQRGLHESTIREFSLGLAPDGKDELYRHLLEKGYEKKDLLQSGLAVSRDSEGRDIIDRFQLRLMIPIDQAQGDFVAFGGRALKKGDQPKYVNSPEHPLYSKSHILYNLSRAKPFIKEEGVALVVEGYMDTMASWQAGAKNVVAVCGTALTEDQVRLLKRYAKKIILAFDADAAGQQAILRAVQLAQGMGVELLVLQITGGKDAADLVKQDPGLWIKTVAEAKPYLEFYLESKQKEFDLTTAAGKRDLTDFYLDLMKGVQHPVERDHFLKALSKVIGTPMDSMYDYLNQLKSKDKKGRRSAAPAQTPDALSKLDRLTNSFIGLLLAYPSVCFPLLKKLSDFELFQIEAQNLELIKPLNKLDEIRYADFYTNFPDLLGEKSNVYKQATDYYNAVGTVDGEFFSRFELGSEFQKLAFEAEIQNPNPDLVPHEFTNLLTQLYFELLSRSAAKAKQ